MNRLRPGRKFDINYPGMEPITCTVYGEPRLLEPEALISPTGELVPRRKTRLVQIYTDVGMRTVELSVITLL